MVNNKSPVRESYIALVAVNVAPVFAVIELTPALTNLWLYISSVTPIETEPLYPEPKFKSA